MRSFDNDRKWFDQIDQSLTWAQYQVEDTQVIVGNRPDIGTTKLFYESIDGWINVSDRQVRHPAQTLNVWNPWNEGGQPPIEVIFAVLKTLDYWIHDLRLPRIYIHCDGGTHRAVTLFGFYLLAYQKEKAQQINETKLLIGRIPEHWSNPIEYAKDYVKENKIPQIDLFLNKLQEGSKTLPDSPTGVSLDSFLMDEIGKDKLRDYYRERFFKNDLKDAWWQLKFSLSHFIVYDLWKTPLARIKIYTHKKLNTKLGQWYKKNNF